jgi:hypothetical protein
MSSPFHAPHVFDRLSDVLSCCGPVGREPSILVVFRVSYSQPDFRCLGGRGSAGWAAHVGGSASREPRVDMVFSAERVIPMSMVAAQPELDWGVAVALLRPYNPVGHLCGYPGYSLAPFAIRGTRVLKSRL